MKHVLIILFIMLMLYILMSCKKQIIGGSIHGPTISSDLVLGQMPAGSNLWPYYKEILGRKTVGKWSDTCARARLGGANGCVGNSYMAYWVNSGNGFYGSMFAGKSVLNRAFGGSSWVHITMWVDATITPYNYSKLYLYEGTNELRRGETSYKVVNDFKTAFDAVRSRNPDLKIVILSLIPCPTLWAKRDSIDWINAQYQDYIASDPNAEYLDISTPMQRWSPRRIDSSLWLADGVHPNFKGYLTMSSVMKPNMH